MKKVLLSLLAVAALVLSCQNYDDEFAALNTKIASLESQITSLAELRTAVTGVQSSISALQSAVAAAQAAAEAADNSDAITALATSVSAIAADLVDLQTAIDAATTEADLDALKDELNTTLAALQALIEANTDSIASLIANDADLKDALDELGVDVDSVLASNATFEGNLTITNDAELAYAKSLGNKVATIKGDVYVKVDAFDHTSGGDGTGLTAAEVNSVLSQITYVVGNVKIDADESLDLSSMTSVTGDYIVIGHDVSDDALVSVGGDVSFDYDGPYVSKIQTAGNIFLTVRDSKKAASDGSTVAEVGTTSIDFLALTKATGVQSVDADEASAHTSGASVTYGSTEADQKIATSKVTTSVKIGAAPVVSVTSGVTAATTALTTIELHYLADSGAAADGLNPNGVAKLASLTLTGAEISSAVVKAKQIDGAVDINVMASTATSNTASIDLSSALTIKGKLSSNAATNTITSLKSVGGIDLTEQTTFSAPALTSSTGTIELDEATTFVADKLVTVAADAKATTAPADIIANKVEGSVTLPALQKAGDISMVLVTSFSASNAKIEAINIKDGVTTTAPTSIELGSLSTYAAAGSVVAGTLTDKANVTTLKLHSQDFTFDLTEVTAATTIVYKGKAASNGSASVDATVDGDNKELVTLELGGVLRNVSVNTAQANYLTTKNTNANTDLATVKTSGTIVKFEVFNNFDLATLTMDHTDDAKSDTAPIIRIKDNNNLKSIKTSVKKISELTITGNSKLEDLNLASISELPNNFVATGNNADTIVIDIQDNEANPNTAAAGQTANDINTIYGDTDVTAAATKDKLSSWYGFKGTYQAATANQDREYGQSGLATLKPFLALVASTYKLDDTDSDNDIAVPAGTSFTMEYRYDTTLPTDTNPSTGVISLTGKDATAFLKYADLK